MPVHLPGWDNADVIVVVAAEMGAKFEQCIVNCLGSTVLKPLRENYEFFFLVDSGAVEVSIAGKTHRVETDSYAYLPPDSDWQITAENKATLLVFTKPYISIAGHSPPDVLIKAVADVPAEPFLGDEGALLQVLLPDSLRHDWGINLFDFVPGGTLPNVESHFMEHGLFLLGGQGVYRLGEHWYPVSAGDCIWMGPFVPQWYVAAGKTHSRYLYYKEMNRPAVS